MRQRGCRLTLFVTAMVFAVQAWSAESVPEKKVHHLRFKDGPVCMCVNGISEAQIQAATKAREAGAKTGASPATPTSKAHDQQKAGGS